MENMFYYIYNCACLLICLRYHFRGECKGASYAVSCREKQTRHEVKGLKMTCLFLLFLSGRGGEEISPAPGLKDLKKQKLFHCLFDSNGNGYGHTDHRIVTRADQAHHFFALGVWKGLQSGETSLKVLLYKT